MEHQWQLNSLIINIFTMRRYVCNEMMITMISKASWGNECCKEKIVGGDRFLIVFAFYILMMMVMIMTMSMMVVFNCFRILHFDDDDKRPRSHFYTITAKPLPPQVHQRWLRSFGKAHELPMPVTMRLSKGFAMSPCIYQNIYLFKQGSKAHCLQLGTYFRESIEL